MKFSMLSVAVLSAILSPAVAAPASATLSIGTLLPTPTASTLKSGFQFQDVQVNCPDADHQNNYTQCYNDNSSKQCNPMQSQADRKACNQLWEVMCAERVGCQVSEN
ncbi:hypothetical protein F4781DRAFT_435975 [Annulohypoxylon bovei var. microspora]|nr:hypothetical protein F4781DRAFT_435975 [Annulohypoxylon bovei var. microspora]